MPLDRTNVTNASRIMLPTYPILMLGAGLVYWLVPDAQLLQSPAFTRAAAMMPLWTWGATFIAIALTQAVALLTHSRRLYLRSLGLGTVLIGIWALLQALSIPDGASPSSPMRVGFAAVSCWASLRSLASGEVTNA